MALRPTRSKCVSALEKRLGRSLSADETLRLAAYVRAAQADGKGAAAQEEAMAALEAWGVQRRARALEDIGCRCGVCLGRGTRRSCHPMLPGTVERGARRACLCPRALGLLFRPAGCFLRCRTSGLVLLNLELGRHSPPILC